MHEAYISHGKSRAWRLQEVLELAGRSCAEQVVHVGNDEAPPLGENAAQVFVLLPTCFCHFGFGKPVKIEATSGQPVEGTTKSNNWGLEGRPLLRAETRRQTNPFGNAFQDCVEVGGIYISLPSWGVQT